MPRTISVGVALLAASLMGCASPPQLDASDSEALGACTGGREPFGDHIMGLYDRIHLVGGWVHLSGEQTRATVEQAVEGHPIVVRVEERQFIAGQPREEILLGEPSRDRLKRVVHDADQVYIGTDVQAEDPTNVVVITDAEGSASFLGSCHYERYTETLADLAADLQTGTAEDALVRLIHDEIELPDDRA